MQSSNAINTSTLETNQFEELNQAVTGWDQDYCQMSPGKFSGGLRLVQVGATQILRIRWGRKIKYAGTAPPGAFAFALPFEQPDDIVWVGKKADLNTVAIQAPNKEGALISSDFYDALVLGVPDQHVLNIVSSLSGEETFGDRFHGAVSLPGHRAAVLRHMGNDLLFQMSGASQQDEVRFTLALDQFVKLFLWEMVDAQTAEDASVEPGKNAKIVQQASELVLANPTANLGLVDLCAHCDISLRALHYAFSHTTGLSAATWLRRLRLNGVHKALSAAQPRSRIIQNVANDFGFSHSDISVRNMRGFSASSRHGRCAISAFVANTKHSTQD